MNWPVVAFRVGWVLLWLLVGLVKTMALVLLLTAADARAPDALAYLLLAWGGIALALLWRARMQAT